ncbi:MAG: type II toxin-antitoxin system RelE/ParE family toxin [Bacteroidota bacterium]
MNIRFSEQALEDTLTIYDQLEAFRNGLGERFYDAIRVDYERIRQNPFLYQRLGEAASKRRAILKLTNRLHYRIIFEVIGEMIEIQAIRSTYQN